MKKDDEPKKIKDEDLNVSGGANTEKENETSGYESPKRPTDPPGAPGTEESYKPW